MPRRWELPSLSIIFAEDDLVFREIALPAITKVGIPEEHVMLAEHGQEALDALQELQDGNPDDPIVMLLDMRMPTMDGNTCARKVKELKDQGRLKRIPYLVCCSAGVEQVSFGDEDGQSSIFHITMPKPFSNKEVNLVMKNAEAWWRTDDAPVAGAASGWDLRKLQVIIGDTEPICRMALSTNLQMMGVLEDNIIEADSVQEVSDNVETQAANAGSMPVMIFLSGTTWAQPVRTAHTSSSGSIYIVCHAVDSEDSTPGFDTCLGKQSNVDAMKTVVGRCQNWWQSKG